MHLRKLKLVCRRVQEKIHFQENTLFDLDPNEEMHLQENTLNDLDLVVKVIRIVVQYPRHHMTYAPATFEAATSNS